MQLPAIKNIENYFYGNRCGHIKDCPRFYQPPSHHKERPYYLQKAIDKLPSLFFQPKSRFIKRLNAARVKKNQIRSERLEAIISVTQVLVHYLETWTLRVGLLLPTAEFLSYDTKFIAAKAGITLIRTKRAMADLVAAGYLHVKRCWTKLDNDKYKSLAGIRTLSTRLLIDLGIPYHKLFGLREWKRKRHEKMLMRAYKQQGHSFIGGIIKKALKTHNNNVAIDTAPKQNTRQKQLPEEIQKKIADEILKIKRLNPHLEIRDIYIELLAKYTPKYTQ